MEGLFLGRLIDSKSLVIIVVEGIQSVGVIRHHLEEGIRLVVRQQRLILYCASQHSYQLAQLANLLLSDALIYCIAFYKVVFDDSYPLHLFDMKASTPRITEEEIALNPRAKSAKLRVFERA